MEENVLYLVEQKNILENSLSSLRSPQQHLDLHMLTGGRAM